MGFGPAACAAPPPASPAPDLNTAEGVLSAKLVPFKDISELQERNASLMRAMRQLTAEHEVELERQRAENEQALASALVEVQKLAEVSQQQQQRIETLGQQGELYKSLCSPPSGGRTVSVSSAGTAAAAAADPLAPVRAASGASARSAAGLAAAAAAEELAAVRSELERLRSGSAATEADLSSLLAASRAAEQVRRDRG